MPKHPVPLYDHNARPVTTRTFTVSGAGVPNIATSRVPVTPAVPLPPLPPPAYCDDNPMDVDDDFDVMEPPDYGNDLDVNEEVPPLTETIAPGLNV